MRNRIIASFLLAFVIGTALAQPLFETPCRNLTTDNLGNVYAWHDANLIKYSPQGEYLLEFRKPDFGNLSSVCADNSIKIMLFYQESGKIVFLDDKLSPVGNILDLFEHNLSSITNATLLGNNQIVLFDESNQDLMIADLNLNVISKTHCDNELNIHPSSLQCIPDHAIMLVDSTQGLFLFDNFGTYERLFPVQNIISAQQVDDKLCYLKDNTIHIYNRTNHELHTLPYLPKHVEVFRWANRFLYLLDNEGHVFRYSE